jgi:hypothetical protein
LWPDGANPTVASIRYDSARNDHCDRATNLSNPSGGGGPNQELGAGSTFTITIAPPGVQTSWGINYCDQTHAAQQVCGA